MITATSYCVTRTIARTLASNQSASTASGPIQQLHSSLHHHLQTLRAFSTSKRNFFAESRYKRPPGTFYTSVDQPNNIYFKGSIPKYDYLSDDKFKNLVVPDLEISDREFVEPHLEDYAEVYGDDPAKRQAVEDILKAYEFIKYNTVGAVPSQLTKQDIEQFFQDHTLNIEKYIRYLFLREMAKRQTLRAKQKRSDRVRALQDARTEKGDGRTGLFDRDGGLIYGLWHNTLFPRVSETTIKAGNSQSRLMDAALFGHPLILDFGFEQYMEFPYLKNACEQAADVYGVNKMHFYEPFDLWWCNLGRNSKSSKYLSEKALKNLYGSAEGVRRHSFITATEDCFMNYFDPRRLVYLSPDAKIELNDDAWCNDDIYIIGVLNDKKHIGPVTLRKANRLGIRSRRLPIDRHVMWSSGTKSLCVDHVALILLELTATKGNWQEAFRKHIPPRKVKTLDMLKSEEAYREAKTKVYNERRQSRYGSTPRRWE